MSLSTPWFHFIMKLFGKDMNNIEGEVGFHLKTLIKRKTSSLDNAKKYIEGIPLFEIIG